MRRWRPHVALAGLAVLAVGALVLWPRAPSRVTRENFRRIQPGMTLSEVESVLGPEGDYRTGPPVAESGPDVELWRPTCTPHCWAGDEGILVVVIDETGHTEEAFVWPTERKAQGFADTLLWRAKRQWHRWFP
jgi:hypothetical protein